MLHHNFFFINIEKSLSSLWKVSGLHDVASFERMYSRSPHSCCLEWHALSSTIHPLLWLFKTLLDFMMWKRIGQREAKALINGYANMTLM